MAESTGVGDSDPPSPERLLSVVVITYNEAERIEDCLESVIAACDPLDHVEVVLVDSRSTDRTVEIARAFPVTVHQLPAEPQPTPGAGRYVGTTATRGDLVLFVDGDMVLRRDWLQSACRRVRADATLAGVDGHLNDAAAESDRPTNVLHGVALYDRRALADVGGFDPFLEALEDIDLSFRLLEGDYRLVRLADVVADHPVGAGRDRARRWTNGYYHGRGQLFRKYVSRPRLLARLAYRTRLHLGILAWLVVGAVATAVADRRAILGWAASGIAGFVGLSTFRSVDWTVDKLVGCGPVYAGVALGVAQPRPSADEYPLSAVETVQSAPAHGGDVPAR